MHLLVGFGAGSSVFDAKVNVRDNATKKIIGEIDANKMSWALGVGIAGAQDVRSHMDAAASVIVDEFVSAKELKQ